MTLTFGRLLADVWAVFRREADLILRVAGPLLFVPAFALLLLAEPMPEWPGTGADETVMNRWFAAFETWGNANAHWYVLGAIVSIFGQAAIATLLLNPARMTVGEALRAAGPRLPRYVLAGAIANLATGLGFLALILPGMFLYARLVALVPVVANERHGAIASIGRSVRLTRGATLAILGALMLLFVMQWVAVAPLAPIDRWLRAPGHDNPFVIALVDAGVAAIGAAHSLAVLLLGIVVYRRLASEVI